MHGSGVYLNFDVQWMQTDSEQHGMYTFKITGAVLLRWLGPRDAAMSSRDEVSAEAPLHENAVLN